MKILNLKYIKIFILWYKVVLLNIKSNFCLFMFPNLSIIFHLPMWVYPCLFTTVLTRSISSRPLFNVLGGFTIDNVYAFNKNQNTTQFKSDNRISGVVSIFQWRRLIKLS